MATQKGQAMARDNDAPLTQAQLWKLDDVGVTEDRRPWGEATESASTFSIEGDSRIELVRSKLYNNAYTLQTSGVIHQGLPVIETNTGEVYTRTMAERLEARRPARPPRAEQTR